MNDQLVTPPLNRDQVVLVKNDNVVGDNVSPFRDLDIEPLSLRSVIDGYI